MVNEWADLPWVLSFSSAITYCPHMVQTHHTVHGWKRMPHTWKREKENSACAQWSLSDVWLWPVDVRQGNSGCGLGHSVPCLGSWWCDGKLFPLLLIFDEESLITSIYSLAQPHSLTKTETLPCHLSLLSLYRYGCVWVCDLVELALWSYQPHVSI